MASMADVEATMAMDAFEPPPPQHTVTATDPPHDILDVVEPSAQKKAEMRRATQAPSAWLRLLCRDWCLENETLVAGVDATFLRWKAYLRGQLTSQLLCRLSIGDDAGGGGTADPEARRRDPAALDFWKALGVDDEFDRAHIVANIERFCSLYNIRGGTLDEPAPCPGPGPGPRENHAAPAALFMGNHLYDAIAHPMENAADAGLAGLPTARVLYPMDSTTAYATSAPYATQPPPPPPPGGGAAAKARPPSIKGQERRLKAEARERERRAYAARKARERVARRAARAEDKRRKLARRREREERARGEQEAALRRAAALVRSSRVPPELTRGAAAAARAAPAAAEAPAAVPPAPAAPGLPPKKGRSSIVISTASDLDRIVTHANNLWAKYNAIAKEHNRKVNWTVVAKELGLHVKVREKYARMHLRATSRGFDFANWGHYRIKDNPQFFLDPLVGPAPGAEVAAVAGATGGDRRAEPLRPQPVPEILPAAATAVLGAPRQETPRQWPVTETAAMAIRDTRMLAAEANDPPMVVAAEVPPATAPAFGGSPQKEMPRLWPVTETTAMAIQDTRMLAAEAAGFATAYSHDPPMVVAAEVPPAAGTAIRGAPQQEMPRLWPVTETAAMTMQDTRMLAAEAVGFAMAYSHDPPMVVAAEVPPAAGTAVCGALQEEISRQWPVTKTAAVAIQDTRMLAADVAGLAMAYSNDPPMVVAAVAAATEVQHPPPPLATTGKGVHVVPPFPQVDTMPADDTMKTVNL